MFIREGLDYKDYILFHKIIDNYMYDETPLIIEKKVPEPISINHKNEYIPFTYYKKQNDILSLTDLLELKEEFEEPEEIEQPVKEKKSKCEFKKRMGKIVISF